MTTAQADLQAALALHQRGRLADAEAAYRALLERHGSNADAEHMLGVVLHAQGRSEEALPWFERAGKSRSGAMLWTNHSAALLALGRAREAAELARRATDADPSRAGAWLNLGLAEEMSGNFRAAIDAFDFSIRSGEIKRETVRAAARCELMLGNPGQAIERLERMQRAEDGQPDLLLPEALIQAGEHKRALELLAAAGNDIQVEILKAHAQLTAGFSDKALLIYGSIVDRHPDQRSSVVGAAALHIRRGDCDDGIDLLRRWVENHPNDTAAASNYLIACQYSERFDAAQLLAEAKKFVPTSVDRSTSYEFLRRQSGRALRIGWLASGAGAGPLRIFVDHVWSALAKQNAAATHIVYSNAISPQSTSSFQFVDISGIGDAVLLQRMGDDDLDILVDLVGRAAGNRIAVVASRVAPIQIGWLDVFYSTGLPTMDYLLSDEWLTPTESEQHFSEKILRLPHGRLAYSPPPTAPVNVDAAAIKTFVSLNRFSKLNDHVIDIWSRILVEARDWSLLLKAHGIDDDDAKYVVDKFVRRGIDRRRVIVEREGSYADAMHAYDRASIALDPFPFNGCSTTCDALWQGLPVVTLPRSTIASRQSAAWLSLAGKEEWIARDEHDYVDIALRLAANVGAREAWRRTARDVLLPTICDSRRLADELARALRECAAKKN